ncbi:MAG TPA: hypothetical protein VH251_12060 [Verrucomicrobiae bacterium]|jgi:hypothetical protein|nr:hypothetical protein [Verrucomicrobiae bacterium]
MTKPVLKDNKRRASFSPKYQSDAVPVVKPVRRGRGKWLMFPRDVKISRATIAPAIRADRGTR